MPDILMNVLNGVNKRLKDMGDSTFAEVVYTANGGAGGGGSALADVLLTDAAGVLFVARDNGSAITYVRVDTGAAYSPVAPLAVAETLASGTDNTGVTQPSGGSGLRGWLSGIYGGLASLVTTGTGKAARVVLVDPNTGNGSLVQAFHNADNQSIGSTSYGLLTGGVGQLLNASGTLDRKRAVSGDGMVATGIAAQTPMLWNGTSYDRAPGTAALGMKVAVSNLPATQAISASALPLPTGAAQDGADATGIMAPNGGSGIRGWLSGIYSKLSSPLAVTGTFWQSIQPVSGSVSISNLPATQAISASVLPLPTGAALDSTLAVLSAKFPSLGPQTMANSSAVNIASDQTVTTNSPGVSTSGSISAVNGAVALLLNGAGGAIIDLRGAFVATVAFQGTVDGTNWISLAAIPVTSGANAAAVSTAAVTGAWHVLTAGFAQIRAVATAFTSGMVTVSIRATTNSPWVYSAPVGTTNAVAVSSLPVAPAGTNLIGDLGLQYRANNMGAALVGALMSPAVPAALAVKAASGRLLGVMLQNSASGVRSVKFWNALAAGVTLGTTAALFEIDIPAGQSVYMAFEGGIGFSTGITCAVTAAKGLNDTTATGLVANDVSGSLIFA